jgi:hypothetical protein
MLKPADRQFAKAQERDPGMAARSEQEQKDDQMAIYNC